MLHGFSNVDYAQTSDDASTQGFQLGQFVLHMSSSLGGKVSFFAETSFTAHTASFTTEVERVILRYDFNDRLKLSLGRYHTPINYWNTAYHHGLWLQTPISRPDMIQSGGTFQPVHFVGLLAEGTLPSAALGLGYNLAVGNGRGQVLSRAGDAGDVNDNRAWVAKLYSRPAAVPALEFGGAVYHDVVATNAPAPTAERITSGYVALTRESPELIAEVSHVAHHDRTTGLDYSNNAFYVQGAYRLPQAQAFKPYARFERLLTEAGDPMFPEQDQKTTTAGLRCELSSYAALKAEYRHIIRLNGSVDGFYLQAAWSF
jgi:hypothetical protein